MASDLQTEVLGKTASDEETATVQLVSGALAGLVAEVCTHPIDTVRARLQHQRGVGQYKGLINTFGRVLQAEGVRGVFGGLPPVLLFTIPAHALYFFGYETSKRMFEPDKSVEEKSTWVHFVSGLWAEFAGAILWTPQDVVKQRLQVLPPSQREPTLVVMRKIVQAEGPQGLWKGFGAGLLTYGPFVGTYFVCYEQFKVLSKKWTGAKSEKELAFPYFLASGAAGGAIGAAVTCPLDVVKTRMQIEAKSNLKYATIRSAYHHMVKEEGYSSLWKGFSARISWIAPSCALTLAFYEQFKMAFIRT